MARCCTGSWHAPVYFTVSVVLAFVAISTSLHSKSEDPMSPAKLTFHELSLNASKALRRANFNVMATLLQISPEIFLSSPNVTIFAIQDDAISNSSLPPWLLKNLLHYHTSTLNLPMEDLLKKPQGSCIPTLHRKKKVAITKINSKARSIEINNVSVSHPNIFLAETISVHGVLEPFSSLAPHVHHGWNIIQEPMCDSKYVLASDDVKSTNMVEWSLIVRLLSSNGFVPFAIGLNSVLDGILEDYRWLDSVTIFAPPSLQSLTSPSPLLQRTVGFHILPQRLTYKELTAMPAGTLLMTLVRDLRLEIAGTASFNSGLVINGVEVVAPDIFTLNTFTVHGISRAFDVAEIPDTPT
ncbi:FAS1 domain containing protein [Parasponia andersonii]|uniref:FAS1 domain containing protein n=1 Tax=Parasponia andersonii TaxID=3476 RepID=A0A2P5E4G6_PARAD|nr:FAS1 domain containing protein [Parasponia andersonii]